MPTQLINGAHIYFERSGEGDEIIVFSHGLLFNHHMWDAQVDYFKNRFCCIAYDHRGQGLSDSIGSVDMDTLYEDAAALIEALSPGKPVHFVGLSMGGFVGMRLAARKPHSSINIKTLVAVGDEDVATTPAKAERIHQAIANSKFKLIARAGHSACIEQPESVNQLIGSFIR